MANNTVVAVSTQTQKTSNDQNLRWRAKLAVFGGFTLYDTQRILQKARMIEGGAPIPYDPLNESISLELNFINLFIRILTILMNQQGGNRRR